MLSLWSTFVDQKNRLWCKAQIYRDWKMSFVSPCRAYIAIHLAHMLRIFTKCFREKWAPGWRENTDTERKSQAGGLTVVSHTIHAKIPCEAQTVWTLKYSNSYFTAMKSDKQDQINYNKKYRWISSSEFNAKYIIFTCLKAEGWNLKKSINFAKTHTYVLLEKIEQAFSQLMLFAIPLHRLHEIYFAFDDLLLLFQLPTVTRGTLDPGEFPLLYWQLGRRGWHQDCFFWQFESGGLNHKPRFFSNGPKPTRQGKEGGPPSLQLTWRQKS